MGHTQEGDNTLQILDGSLFQMSYNIGPYRYIPVVLIKDSQLTITPMQWGVGPQQGYGNNLVINARYEEITEKQMFRTPIKCQRCVVLIDGYYEWKQNVAGAQNKSGAIPYFIHAEDR